jgi:pimeloyl-ACP methyl ester carboxylesterase
MKKTAWLCCGCIFLFSLGLVSGCGGSSETSSTTSPATTPPKTTPAIISEDISWNIGETTVYGTVTRPADGKDLPAVLFIAGSGPTDRDWNSPLLPGSNGSAKLLSEALAEKGFVTLRYDKRFAGPHANDNLPKLIGKISMQSHLDEISGAMDILLARKEVNPGRIFILGHSEGTIHAVNYYFSPGSHQPAGMILAGAPGQSMATLMRAQIAAQLVGFPNADAIMAMYDKAVNSFIATGTMDTDPSLPDGIKNLLAGFTSPVNLPFTREFLSADITPQLPQTNIPVLIIIGKKDIQVNWQVDGSNLQKAAEDKTNIVFSFPENANHVLKYEIKPKSAINLTDPGYNAAGAILDTDTVNTIVSWLENIK